MFKAWILGVFALAALMQPAFAQETSPEAKMILKLFGPGPAAEADFAPEFLAIVPIGKVREILEAAKAEMGAPEGVLARTGDYLLSTASHEIAIQIGLDTQGRVAGLLLRPPVKRHSSLEEALGTLESLSALAPEFSYLVTKDGAVLAAKNENQALAVGSAFKLGILAAIQDKVGKGELAWDQVVRLKDADKSLPSGILQDWPADSPVTLAVLGGLMISLSDNTAADNLLDIAGREAVTQKLGSFALKTRELFLLKATPEDAEAFRQADAAGKAELVAGLARRPLPSAAAVSVSVTPGVEWYVPVTKLCALIEEVGGLDLMAINPGLARKPDWARVAFKGGSEIGVLNYTTLLTGKDGHRYCLSATLNNPAGIEETKLDLVYAGLIAQLAVQGSGI